MTKKRRIIWAIVLAAGIFILGQIVGRGMMFILEASPLWASTILIGGVFIVALSIYIYYILKNSE